MIPVIKTIKDSQMIFKDQKFVPSLLASLLQLLPLNLQSIQSIDEELSAFASEGLNFLKTFVNNEMVEEYKLEVPVNADLRLYQKQGITWLATLIKYNLNCALCDDMGLGKTLQSLCVVVNESYKVIKKGGKKPVSLVVCPISLMHNWRIEIQKFFPKLKLVVEV